MLLRNKLAGTTQTGAVETQAVTAALKHWALATTTVSYIVLRALEHPLAMW
jgi:hypothetical protein